MQVKCPGSDFACLWWVTVLLPLRVSRSRVQLDRDEVSQGEGDGYRSGVGTPSWQGVDGGRVAIGR